MAKGKQQKPIWNTQSQAADFAILNVQPIVTLE